MGLTEWERDGDVVWRPAGPSNAGVHELLTHLEQVGFSGAPRSLGLAPDGRLRLSWVPGDSGSPEGGSDTALHSTAVLIRRFHDAQVEFDVPASLEPMVGAPSEGPLVCHNDLAPTNTVYDGDRAIALIDFDLAGPGDAAWDLAYAAWRHVPLYDADFFAARSVAMPDQPRRLRLLLDSYGLTDRAGFVEVICARMQSLYDTARVWGGEQRRAGWVEVWDGTGGHQWLASLRHARLHADTWTDAIKA